MNTVIWVACSSVCCRQQANYIAWAVLDLRKLTQDGSLEVSAVCGHPGFKGAGQLLMVALLVTIESKHKGMTCVLVEPDTPKLRELYKEVGFKPVQSGNRKKLHMTRAELEAVTVVNQTGVRRMLQPWSKRAGRQATRRGAATTSLGKQ